MTPLFYAVLLFACIHPILSEVVVTQLTDATWDDTVTTSGIWMVKFYAPWCGHCKKYAPIFKKTALITSYHNGYINFGEIDCDAHKVTCGEYHITGYPTTLLLFNGKLIANYKESRNSATKIKSWLLKNLNPAQLRDANMLHQNEIDTIIQIAKKWTNTNYKANNNINAQNRRQ
eukprot:UN04711